MSQPDLSSANPPGVIAQKPKTSIYTMLLFVALVCLLLGCIFLLLELNKYGGFGQVTGTVSSLWQPATAAFQNLA